ncbi:MAG: U32 family peptidase [Clostridiales bacterium]|nr:U32 family peptidase [Clostridiales bacterium]
MRKKPEVLAPANSLEVLKTAVEYGADAVYIGGEMYGLRAKAKNFSAEDMKKGIEYAHKRGKKVYVTANITAHNRDLEGVRTYFRELKEIRPDALIISDPGVFTIARDVCPEIDIHISTQSNNVNYMTFRFWKDQGATRVVTARELSLEEIGDIRRNIPEEFEIETFVHGAMCISYSGRCLLSHYFTGRDANLGACTHPCRWKYYIMEEKRPGEFLPVEENERGTYIFNSKDLCMIEHIPELVRAGIDSFKIEGRMKTALYVAVVSRTYRQAIDDYFEDPQKYKERIPYYKKEIAKCTYRQFTTGFFFGPTTHDSQIYDNNTYVKGYEYLGTIHEKLPDGQGVFEQKNKFCVGDEVEIMKPNGENVVTKVLSMEDEKGQKVDSCPHPGQRIRLRVECELQEYDIIRKEKEVNEDECEGGSPCHS